MRVNIRPGTAWRIFVMARWRLVVAAIYSAEPIVECVGCPPMRYSVIALSQLFEQP